MTHEETVVTDMNCCSLMDARQYPFAIIYKFEQQCRHLSKYVVERLDVEQKRLLILNIVRAVADVFRFYVVHNQICLRHFIVNTSNMSVRLIDFSHAFYIDDTMEDKSKRMKHRSRVTKEDIVFEAPQPFDTWSFGSDLKSLIFVLEWCWNVGKENQLPWCDAIQRTNNDDIKNINFESFNSQKEEFLMEADEKFTREYQKMRRCEKNDTDEEMSGEIIESLLVFCAKECSEYCKNMYPFLRKYCPTFEKKHSDYHEFTVLEMEELEHAIKYMDDECYQLVGLYFEEFMEDERWKSGDGSIASEIHPWNNLAQKLQWRFTNHAWKMMKSSDAFVDRADNSESSDNIPELSPQPYDITNKRLLEVRRYAKKKHGVSMPNPSKQRLIDAIRHKEFEHIGKRCMKKVKKMNNSLRRQKRIENENYGSVDESSDEVHDLPPSKAFQLYENCSQSTSISSIYAEEVKLDINEGMDDQRRVDALQIAIKNMTQNIRYIVNSLMPQTECSQPWYALACNRKYAALLNEFESTTRDVMCSNPKDWMSMCQQFAWLPVVCSDLNKCSQESPTERWEVIRSYFMAMEPENAAAEEIWGTDASMTDSVNNIFNKLCTFGSKPKQDARHLIQHILLASLEHTRSGYTLLKRIQQEYTSIDLLEAASEAAAVKWRKEMSDWKHNDLSLCAEINDPNNCSSLIQLLDGSSKSDMQSNEWCKLYSTILMSVYNVGRWMYATETTSLLFEIDQRVNLAKEEANIMQTLFMTWDMWSFPASYTNTSLCQSLEEELWRCELCRITFSTLDKFRCHFTHRHEQALSNFA